VTEGLIALFATPLYRLPNLIVAHLTRDSVQRAFREYGLTATHILNFLERNAHVQCRNQRHLRDGVVPKAVVAQIHQWENERNRIRIERGVLYDGFSSINTFTVVTNYAQQLSVLLYSNPVKRQLVVTDTAHHVIKQYIKSITTHPSSSISTTLPLSSYGMSVLSFHSPNNNNNNNNNKSSN
jgi:transcription initiation factor TFIIH subunit 4